MRNFILAIFAFVSIFLALFMYIISLTNSTNKFLPENDLYLEDCINCESLSSKPVTQDLFNRIVDAGKKAFATNAKANNETLKINALWTNTTVNADCSRSNKIVTVNMYGALARRKEITPEGFALVLGHELEHAYGGAPFYPNETLSAEGQADYMSTKEAYAKIAVYVPELKGSTNVDDFIMNTCAKKYGTFADNRYSNCLHMLSGGLSLANLLSVLNGDIIPNYTTPDLTIVSKTETSYPATTQCRLDTYLSGALNGLRPKCWFYK